MSVRYTPLALGVSMVENATGERAVAINALDDKGATIVSVFSPAEALTFGRAVLRAAYMAEHGLPEGVTPIDAGASLEAIKDNERRNNQAGRGG